MPFNVDNTNWANELPIPMMGLGEDSLLIFEEVKRVDFLKPSFESFKRINMFLEFLRNLESSGSEKLFNSSDKIYQARLFKTIPKISYYIEEIDYNINSFQDYTSVYFGSAESKDFEKALDGLSSAMLKAALEYMRRFSDSSEFRQSLNSFDKIEENPRFSEHFRHGVDLRLESSNEDSDHSLIPEILNLPDDDLSHIPSEYEQALDDAKLNLDLLSLLESPKRGPITSPEIKKLKPLYRKVVDLDNSIERDLVSYVESSDPHLKGFKNFLSETNGLRDKRMSFLHVKTRSGSLSSSRKIFRQDDKPSD